MSKPTRPMTPTEEQEQRVLVQWLTLKGYKFFRVPNETFTRSWNQKRKNTALGVRPGVPDLFVIVNDHLLAIELKRVRGGVVSEHQKHWNSALNKCEGVRAEVCRGADEALELIEALARDWGEHGVTYSKRAAVKE